MPTEVGATAICVTTADLIIQTLVNGLTNGQVIALVALGYTIVYGIVNLINFAHGDLFMLGAFAGITVLACFGAPTIVAEPGSLAAFAILALCAVAGGVFCGALNWAADRWIYRPVRSAPKLSSLVTAIGLSFIFVWLGLIWGGLPLGVFNGGNAPTAPKDFPDLIGYRNLLGETAEIQVTMREVVVWTVTVPLLIALTWFVHGTRLGTAMRAVAQDPVAARLMGIDVDRVISAAFVLGGVLAGVAAVVYASYTNTIHFQMGFRLGIDAFAAAVLGGIGSLPGAVVGGLAIGLIRAAMELPDGGSQWANATVFVVLILILVFRPQGLLGRAVREKV